MCPIRRHHDASIEGDALPGSLLAHILYFSTSLNRSFNGHLVLQILKLMIK